MSAMDFQITGASNVCSIVGSGADQRKHQSSASLAFVWWPVTGEFPEQRASNAENVSIWWRHHLAISCGKSFARPLQANSAFFFYCFRRKTTVLYKKYAYMFSDLTFLLFSFSQYIVDPNYIKYFEKTYAFVDDITFGLKWTMPEIKSVIAEFKVRSAIECGIQCKWNFACIAWQVEHEKAMTKCLHLSSYE